MRFFLTTTADPENKFRIENICVLCVSAVKMFRPVIGEE